MSDFSDLANEIIKPTNPESMAEKVERQKLNRQYVFAQAFRQLLNDYIRAPEGHHMVIEGIDITGTVEEGFIADVSFKYIPHPSDDPSPS